MPAVLLLPTGKTLTVRTAADAFLDALANPNTVRNYGFAVGKTAERIGEGRSLAAVEDDEIGEALELPWGSSVVNTWNGRRGAVRPGRTSASSAATTAWPCRPVGEADRAAGLGHPGALEDGHRPADRPP